MGDSNNWDKFKKFEIKFNDKQMGKKWGKHKTDYPSLNNYSDYKSLAQDTYQNAEKVIYDNLNKEFYFIRGKDLLRVSESGNFISLYPGATTERVINAIRNGGLLWQQ